MAFLLVGIEHIITCHAVDEVPATAADDFIPVLLLIIVAAPVVVRQNEAAAVQNIGIIAAMDPVALKTAENKVVARAGACYQGKTRILIRLQRSGIYAVTQNRSPDFDIVGRLEAVSMLLLLKGTEIKDLGRSRRSLVHVTLLQLNTERMPFDLSDLLEIILDCCFMPAAALGNDQVIIILPGNKLVIRISFFIYTEP